MTFTPNVTSKESVKNTVKEWAIATGATWEGTIEKVDKYGSFTVTLQSTGSSMSGGVELLQYNSPTDTKPRKYKWTYTSDAKQDKLFARVGSYIKVRYVNGDSDSIISFQTFLNVFDVEDEGVLITRPSDYYKDECYLCWNKIENKCVFVDMTKYDDKKHIMAKIY